MQIYRSPMAFCRKNAQIIDMKDIPCFTSEYWDKESIDKLEDYIPKIADQMGVHRDEVAIQTITGEIKYIVISNFIELNAMKNFAELLNEERAWLREYESKFLYNNWR